MHESLFQTQVMREMRTHGWIGKHLSPPSEPGFPDLVLWKGPLSIMIELKVIRSFDSSKRFGNIFTDAQLPWVVRWLQEGGMPIYVGILANKDDERAFIVLRQPAQVIDYKDREIRDFDLETSGSTESFAIRLLSHAHQWRDLPR